MSKPEITPYGDNPFGEPREFVGMLYRYEGAEHIGIETCPTSVHVKMSTTHDANSVKDNYERIFGVTAVVEDVPEDSDAESTVDELETPANRVSITLGPLCLRLVQNGTFTLAWFPPHQIFYDRDAESAKVFMSQAGPVLDVRHEAFLASIAEDDVKADLSDILNNT